MGKKINKYLKNAYKVASGQKLEAVIANPKDSPFKISLKKEVFDQILQKHPDQPNVDFNKALGFVETLNIPTNIQILEGRQRINFVRSLTDGYEGWVNKAGTKPLPADQKSYVTTSFVTKYRKEIKKFLSEGVPGPSSRLAQPANATETTGVSGTLLTSKDIHIIPKNNENI